MINGMTPQQYAMVVADFCNKILSERALDKHTRGLPVTQNVGCALSSPYRYSRTDPRCIEVSERTLTFRFRAESWGGVRAESFGDDPTSAISALSHLVRSHEFCVDFTDDSNMRDTIYNEVLQQASELDTDPNGEVKIDPLAHTVLMFITRIRCGEHENPDTIRAAYIDMMKSKYSLDIPKELIMVSSNMLDYDFNTAVKFVPGNARKPLTKERLKTT